MARWSFICATRSSVPRPLKERIGFSVSTLQNSSTSSARSSDVPRSTGVLRKIGSMTDIAAAMFFGEMGRTLEDRPCHYISRHDQDLSELHRWPVDGPGVRVVLRESESRGYQG